MHHNTCRTRCNIGEATAKRWRSCLEIKPDIHLVNYGDSVPPLLSFCDAVSFVVVTTLLNDIPTLAFDAAFRALGLIVIP